MEKIFNLDIFTKNLEPWAYNIFSQPYDAYFFIDYPHLRYTNEPIELFDFTTNFQEKTLFVHTLNPAKKIAFFYNRRYDPAFFEEFKEKQLANERFLFWHGETGLWAMFSDTKTNIALIAVNWEWQYSSSVQMFFAEQIMPLPQLKTKLQGIVDLKTVLTNYAPSKILTEGSPENPIWVKYYFECKHHSENDKLYYWEQFEKLYQILQKTIKDFKMVKMWACQHFDKLYKMKGQLYNSGSNAPVGGWQKFSYENCKKVATKFLTDNAHLQLQFEGKQNEALPLYLKSEKGLIRFFAWWLYANKEIKASKIFEGINDFFFLLENEGNTFQFFYRKGIIEETDIQILYAELLKIGFVSKVYKDEAPNIHFKYDIDGMAQILGTYGYIPSEKYGIKPILI
jgi:hypothetical protein